MKLDRATRGFLELLGVGVTVGVVVVCGALGGVLWPSLLSSLAHHGVRGLARTSLIPAVVLLAYVLVGALLGTRSLRRQISASRQLARHIARRAMRTPLGLRRLAARLGLEGRIVLVDAEEPFSCVYGMLTPRIALSTGLLDLARASELRAVLEHERYHVRHLDPLRLVVTRVLSDTLFCLPAMTSLRARYTADSELEADRRALALCGREPLVGALVKVVGDTRWSRLEVAAAIGGACSLDARVEQLETGMAPKRVAVGASRVLLSLSSTVLFVGVYLAAAHGAGQAATQHATAAGLASATLLGGLECAFPLIVGATFLYAVIATRAKLPLPQVSRSRKVR